MSEWQGFDPRRVCPNCGGYQTGFGIYKRTTDSPQGALVVLLALALMALPLAAIFILLMLKGAVPDQGRLIGLLLTSLLGLGSILFNRDIRKGLKEYDWTRWDSLRSKPKPSKRERLIEQMNQEHDPSTIYSLSCHDCGHIWEMAAEEWERIGQQEREELINSPAFLPQGKEKTVEPFEKIEWKPPDPNRGILIVVGAIVLSFIAFLSAMGALWYLSNPGHPYAAAIGIIGILLGLLVYAVLAIVLKWKVVKLLPVIGFAFLVIALWFLLK